MAQDLYYTSVSLLLHGNGADGATTIVDNSPTPKTVTNGSGATISTAQSKYGGASIYHSGTTSGITLDGSSAFAFGTGDFTIELWFRKTAFAGVAQFLYDGRNGSQNTSQTLYFDTSNKLAFDVGGVNAISTTTTLTVDTWYHVALCRSGTSTKLFINGTQAGSTYTDTNNYVIAASRPAIAVNGYSGTANLYVGYIDDLRVTKGVARYTSNFTPPAAEFANNSYTQSVGDVTISATPASSPYFKFVSSFAFAGPTLSAESYFAWGAFTLGGFSSSLSSTVYEDPLVGVSLELFSSTLSSSFGTSITSSFSLPILASSVSTVDTISAPDLRLFTSTLSASVTVSGGITASLGFTSSTITALGGASAALTFPTFGLAASVSGAPGATAELPFFRFSLSSTAIAENKINVSAGFITTSLSYWACNLSGPLFSLSSAGSEAVSNAVAYVMNVHTQESTKYTAFNFLHIINIGGKPYGVKSDGLYLLEGTTDNGAAINGTVTTKETDFGTFQSKHAPTVYLNSDTTTTITPIVDSVTYPAYQSTFGGRKTVIARGIAGRYWRFKIDGIQQLEGVEFLPETRQKRVK